MDGRRVAEKVVDVEIEEVTCLSEDNLISKVSKEVGQPHEVLWSGMPCPALEVHEVTGHLCHPSNLNSTRVVNPNGLDPPFTSEITNVLDHPLVREIVNGLDPPGHGSELLSSKQENTSRVNAWCCGCRIMSSL